MIVKHGKIYERQCKVCNHPERDRIDEMLLSGEYTQLDVATQFGFTAPSVNTHVHKHIPIDMAEALDDIIIRSLQKNLAAKDGGDLIRLIEYRDKTEKKLRRRNYKVSNLSLSRVSINASKH